MQHSKYFIDIIFLCQLLALIDHTLALMGHILALMGHILALMSHILALIDHILAPRGYRLGYLISSDL